MTDVRARTGDSRNAALLERSALVREEANLLSYDRAREALDGEPRSYWSTVDASDEPWAGRDDPCV